MNCAKQRFGSRDKAQAALEKIRPDHGEVRVYRCFDCRGWHLTSLSELEYRQAKNARRRAKRKARRAALRGEPPP